MRWKGKLVVALVGGALLMQGLQPAVGSAQSTDSPSVERADPLPMGGSSRAPRQRSSPADDLDIPDSTRTDLSSPERPVVRPAEAVPDRVATPEVVRPKVKRHTLTDVEVRQVAPELSGFDAETSTEEPGDRTEDSLLFSNVDGSETRRLYSAPVHARRPDGSWASIDLDLRTDENDRLQPKLAPYRVDFADTADRRDLASFMLDDDMGVAVGLRDAGAAPARVADQEARYADVRPDVDLALAATEVGMREGLVLRSPDAPTSYVYDLTPHGLEPTLERSSGDIHLSDSDGEIQAMIRAGRMVDDEGAVSHDVGYRLVRSGKRWGLRVDLDTEWLADERRAFPVSVDQSLLAAAHVEAGLDDTYVTKGSAANRSSLDYLKAGNEAGVGISASYLHFPGLTTGALRNQYVVGATLNILNVESPSCTPKPVDVFAVGGPWSGSTMTTWPGAPLGQHLARRSFAFGHAPGCPDGGRGQFPLPASLVTDWTHNRAFHGFSVRAANEGDTGGYKRFGSADAPSLAARPFVDVTYQPHGARYRVEEVTLPTNAHTGRIKARVTNRGSSTWTPTGPHKFGFIVKKNGAVVQTSPKFSVPNSVGPNGTVLMDVPMATLTPDVYQVFLTMYNGNSDYQPTYGVPYGVFDLKVENVEPSVEGQQPGTGAAVDSITPTLFAKGIDTDNWPNTGLKYEFKLCADPEGTTGCVSSGWTNATWTPPAGTMKWSRTYYWWVRAHDNVEAGPPVGPLTLTTQVPQPEITAHLGGTPRGAPAPGIDPQVGNFGMATTDANVRTVGPDLTITRTYNSLDPRTDTAFGQGWASRLDTRLVADDDGSGNVVVTLPTGREVRFGRNADTAAGERSYSPPQGQNLTLVYDRASGFYTLRDATGTQWGFNPHGRLVTITDPAGLMEELEYDQAGPDGRPESIYNHTSRRRLHMAWTDGHVTAIRTDPPATGEPALEWTYEYIGDRLSSACDPGLAPNCTRYAYQAGSHYRSVVLDDNPRGYWRFGESSANDGAANATARTPGADQGTYTGVGVGAQGALAGTADTAAAFGGADGRSRVDLPEDLTSPTMSLAVELWFRTTSGGVLVDYADRPFGTAGADSTPVLYVGKDGHLRGGFRVQEAGGDGARQIQSEQPVDDDAWHHVVLSGTIDRQTLYVDGRAQPGSVEGLIAHDEMSHLVVGVGDTDDWPSGNEGEHFFGGYIDEVAVYQHPLGAPAVAQHHAAARQVQQLTTVTTPETSDGHGRIAAELTYDDINDRVATLTDHDGRTWRLGTPARDEEVRTVTLGGPYPDWTYEFDADHGGRLTASTHDGRTRRYRYNSEGFRSEQVDENGNAVEFTTDDRGNVLSRTTCREPDSCQTSYSTYFLNSDDPLDPRNDRKLTDSDARSDGPDDATYRTGYGYDALGRMVSTSHPRPNGVAQNPTETWEYSTGQESAEGGGNVPAGLLLEHAGKRAGQVTRYKYRSTGDLAERIDPSGLRIAFTYDGIGRTTSKTPMTATGQSFGTTSYTYTARSQVETETGPVVANSVGDTEHQMVTAYTYDANGNTTKVVQSDLGGDDPARTTTHEYNEHDQLISTTHPDGGTETREYRNAGREVRVTDPNGTTWIDTFDSQSRLLRRDVSGPGVDPQDPNSTVLTLEVRSYDAAGRLAVSRDAMGRQTTHTYYDDDLPATVTTAGVLTEQREYDPAGNVVKLTTGGGRVTTSTYDPAGNVATTTVDPNGLARKTTYLRDPDGLVATEQRTGAAQPDRTESVDYGYNAAGHLLREDVEITPGTQLSVTYTRDERGLATSMTDRRRLTTNYTYDAYGRMVGQTLPEVVTWVEGERQTGVRPRTTFGYNAFGDVTHQRDPNGAVTVLDYDERGRNTSTRLPEYTPPGGQPITAAISTTYDALGNPIETIDPQGRVTSRAFDPYGRVVSETRPAVGSQPSTTRYTYDRVGELLSVTEPSGIRRLSTYDDLGRKRTDTAVEREPEPTYFTTLYQYDDADNLTSVTTPSGAMTVTDYNQADEPIEVTDPSGRATSYGYDNVGRVVSTTEPSGLTTRTTYDVLGRATSTAHLPGGSDADQRRWEQAYDPNGNVTRITSPEGRIKTFGYDAADRMVRLDERLDDTTTISSTIGYDPAGNRTRFVDGEQNATDYTFTPWNLPESTIEPGGSTWTAEYDAAGRMVENTAPGGVTVGSEYDAQDRLIAQSGSGAEAPTSDRTFAYDPDGRLIGFGAPGGTTSVGYDDRGNLTSLSGPSGDATFTYDADDRLASRTDVTGTATFTYDPAGRPLSIEDELSGRTIDHTYDDAGRLAYTAERGLGQNLKRVNTYDELDRLTSDKVTAFDPAGGASRIILGTEYGYDLDDNITAKTTIAENREAENAYSYDGLGRLDQWTAPDGAITPYGWDAAGNRIKAGPRTFTYNERNQLVSDGDQTYTYTPRGTLDSVGDRDVAFDAFDQMVSDGDARFGYDSLGRIATYGAKEFVYASLGNDVVSDGTRLISRGIDGEPLSDKAIGATTTGKLLYTDLHGDVIGRYRGLDSFGQRTFDPFGAVTESSGEQPSLGYQGEWTAPDSGAVDMHSRWYSPETGTFTSRDTWTIPVDPSIAANRYTYANGNPVVNADPSGHAIPLICLMSPVCWAAAGAAAKGIHWAIQNPHSLAKGLTTAANVARKVGGWFGSLGKTYVAGKPSPSSAWVAAKWGRGLRAIMDGALRALRFPLDWASYWGDRLRFMSALKRAGASVAGGVIVGPGGVRIPLPPPPPPPLWLTNIQNPPPRPAPGSTTRDRPYSVDVGGGMVVIDRSAEYAEEANEMTVALPGSTMLSGALAAAPLPAADDDGASGDGLRDASQSDGLTPDSPSLPGQPGQGSDPSQPGGGVPELPDIGAGSRVMVEPWFGDAFPDPHKVITQLRVPEQGEMRTS